MDKVLFVPIAFFCAYVMTRIIVEKDLFYKSVEWGDGIFLTFSVFAVVVSFAILFSNPWLLLIPLVFGLITIPLFIVWNEKTFDEIKDIFKRKGKKGKNNDV